MIRYDVTLTGTQPLLMHQDSVEWADQMEDWKNRPENKKKSKAGDDRSPAHRWLGCLYHDSKRIIVPTANIMTLAMEGGSMVLVPGGKSGKTFKAQSQSGILVEDIGWPLLVSGKSIPVAEILKLISEENFSVHRSVALKHGFSLFQKRARVGSAKHIRVRPRFESSWITQGVLAVVDDQITEQILDDILNLGGLYKGLGDWRPGAPKKPGPYGTFTAKVKRIK